MSEKINIVSKDLGENRTFKSNKCASNLYSETSDSNIQPIKFIEKLTNKLQKQVINGDEIPATVVAIPKCKNA